MSEFKAFRLYLVVEKGLSKLSADAYIQDLNIFEKITGTSPNGVTEGSFVKFLKALRHQEYADSTITRMVISLRVYQKYLFLTSSKSRLGLFLETPRAMQPYSRGSK